MTAEGETPFRTEKRIALETEWARIDTELYHQGNQYVTTARLHLLKEKRVILEQLILDAEESRDQERVQQIRTHLDTLQTEILRLTQRKSDIDFSNPCVMFVICGLLVYIIFFVIIPILGVKFWGWM